MCELLAGTPSRIVCLRKLRLCGFVASWAFFLKHFSESEMGEEILEAPTLKSRRPYFYPSHPALKDFVLLQGGHPLSEFPGGDYYVALVFF